MPNTNTLYLGLDKTGQSTNNRIELESHTLPNTLNKLIIPKYGAFFSESIQVYWVNELGQNVLLQKGVDYHPTEMLEKVTAASGNRGAAIKLEGCLRPVVVGNSVGFRDWLPVSTSNKESYGIIIGAFGTKGTTDGMFTNNVIEKCHAPFYISNESNGNSICLNQDKNCLAESVLGSGINASNVNISADTGLGFAYVAKRVFSALADGLTVARFAGVLSAVNFVELANAVTGSPAEVRARGSDTFIDLMLTPRGSGGRVRYGTHTATSDTAVTGYIEIKDAAGTVRRLAVVS